MFNIKNIKYLILFLAPILIFTGCSSKNNQTITQPDADLNGPENTTEINNKNDRYIIMMGRSVMRGWFDHWGWDQENPMQLERYTLEFKELSGSPGMVDSVKEIMGKLPENKKDIIFFKLCFEDFLGDNAAADNLENNKNIIKEIHKIVTQEHGAKLIIGNALPKVIADTDIYLVWNHQQFISWLNEFWRENPDNVTVFDMYNPITNELGALKTEYATSPNDSHLNNDAYNLLDDKFFDMLDSIY